MLDQGSNLSRFPLAKEVPKWVGQDIPIPEGDQDDPLTITVDVMLPRDPLYTPATSNDDLHMVDTTGWSPADIALYSGICSVVHHCLPQVKELLEHSGIPKPMSPFWREKARVILGMHTMSIMPQAPRS